MRFHPALGDPEGLAETERGLFESEGHAPPPPGLAPREGESFTAFLEAEPVYPRAPRTTLYLRQVGVFEDGLSNLEGLRRLFAAFFGLDARLLPPMDLGEARAEERAAWADGHRQLLAPDVLEALARTLPDDAFFVMGLTALDLYPEPSWSFVYGQGASERLAGVYSFFRTDTGNDAPLDLARRCARVLCHEACHLFGLSHCPFFACLMNPTHSTGDEDLRPLRLCPVCLRKLAYSVGFDVRARYAKLAGELDALGFGHDANWARRRLATTPSAFPFEWSP